MTNWEKWVKDNVGVRYKRDFLCGFYTDCDDCPLSYKANVDCTDDRDIYEWFEREVSEND